MPKDKDKDKGNAFTFFFFKNNEPGFASRIKARLKSIIKPQKPEPEPKKDCKISLSWIMPAITMAASIIIYELMGYTYDPGLIPFLLLMAFGINISLYTKKYFFIVPIIIGLYSFIGFDYSTFSQLVSLFNPLDPGIMIAALEADIKALSAVLTMLTFIVYIGCSIGRVSRDLFNYYFICRHDSKFVIAS